MKDLEQCWKPPSKCKRHYCSPCWLQLRYLNKSNNNEQQLLKVLRITAAVIQELCGSWKLHPPNITSPGGSQLISGWILLAHSSVQNTDFYSQLLEGPGMCTPHLGQVRALFWSLGNAFLPDWCCNDQDSSSVKTPGWMQGDWIKYLKFSGIDEWNSLFCRQCRTSRGKYEILSSWIFTLCLIFHVTNPSLLIQTRTNFINRWPWTSSLCWKQTVPIHCELQFYYWLGTDITDIWHD